MTAVGKITSTGTSTNFPANYIAVSETEEATASFSATAIFLYVGSSNAPTSLTACIYEDDGSDAPGDLLGVTYALTIVYRSHWNELKLKTAVPIVSGTKYHVGWIADDSTTVTYETPAGYDFNYKAETYSAGMAPDPFPSSPTTVTRRYSVYIGELSSNIYYVRQDGTATKDNATASTSASTAMSPATFNSAIFYPGDKVVFSSGTRGGDFTTAITMPTYCTGSENLEIIMEGEAGYLPHFKSTAGVNAFAVGSKEYLILNDLIAGSNASGFYFSGTCDNIVTNNLEVTDATNQGLQHLGSAKVVHNNLTIAGCDDEGVSLHDTSNVTINTIDISGCVSGFNWVGTPTLKVYDFTVDMSGETGKSIDGSLATGGDITFERGTVTENTAEADVVCSSDAGSWLFKNVIFLNLTDATYYMEFLTGVTAIDVINCTFLGDGVNTTTVIRNQITAGKFKNNIFDDVGTEAFYDATGTIDYNLFYSAGTVRGTNTTTTDPSLDSDGRLQSDSSSAVGAGIGPSSDTDIPDDDIDGDTRSGTTTDLGADLWVSTLLSINVTGSCSFSGEVTRKVLYNRSVEGEI